MMLLESFELARSVSRLSKSSTAMNPVASGSYFVQILTYSSTSYYLIGELKRAVMSKNASTMMAMNRLRNTCETIRLNKRKNEYADVAPPQTNG